MRLDAPLPLDHQTLQDDTVTLRDRDTMKQRRVSLSDLDDTLSESLTFPV